MSDKNKLYLKELGYNLDLLDLSQVKKKKEISELAQSFPLKSSGIILVSDLNHISKSALLILGIIEKTNGSIMKIESLELTNFFNQSNIDSLSYLINAVLINNVDPTLLDLKLFIYLIQNLLKANIPIIISTPYTIQEFTSSCTKLLLSNIEPYIIFGV